MPYKRTYRRRPAIRRRKRVAGLATLPRMMTSTNRIKRHNQVSTKVFWYKRAATEQSSGTAPTLTNTFSTYEPHGDILTSAFPQHDLVKQLYDEFKVLAYKVRWFPANVGIEPDATLFGAGQGLIRGDQIVWSDQNSTPTIPTSIATHINQASCKMINPRRPYSRTLYRPKGHPVWSTIVTPPTGQDIWTPSINHFSTSQSPAQTHWYVTVQIKVLYRGRIQS